MEFTNAFKWRKQSLKPIETRRSEKEGGQITAEEEEPLSPLARLFHEPNFNVYVIAIMGCKTRIYPDVVKANLGHTLLKHPRFSSLQVVDEKNKGEMKWVRIEVDLESHVNVPELDPDMDSPDKFLEDYIYNLSKSSIDKSQPLWDLHLLNLRTSESEAVGVFRIHHSLGDGTSLMSLLLACTRRMDDPLALPTIPIRKKQEKNDHRGFWGIFFRFWYVFQVLWNTVVDVLVFVARALFLKDTKNPLKGPPGAELTPRRIVYRTVSLDDLKLVKNAMNTTTMGLPKTKTQIFALFIFLSFQFFAIALSFPGLPHINHPPQLEIPLPMPNSHQIEIGIPFLTPSSQQPEKPPQNPNSPQPDDPSQNTSSQPLENPPQSPDAEQPQPEVPSQPPLEAEDKEFLDAHNKARAHVGEELFEWDETLASYARSWANQRISDCKMIHSFGPYGENIFWGGRDHWTPKDAVKTWIREHKFYNRKTNACLPGRLCGHYTQIVWRDSVRVGCARVKCSNGGIFIMCCYDPPGNYVDENPFLPKSVQS